MKRELIAAIDAGTTGTRCCIFDKHGEIVSSGYVPMLTVYPEPGLAEQDPEKVIEFTFRAVSEAVCADGVDPGEIAGLCLSVMRNSFVPIGPDERFLSNMILWQDQRGERTHGWILECLKKNGLTPEDLYRMNGQPFASFQCGFKALWLRRFREDLYEKTWKIVTPMAYLAHAFGVEEYIDENNNQSFWLVANADTQKIDEDLCRVFDFDPEKFPKTASPGTKVGTVSEKAAGRTGLPAGTPIYLGSGDQQCGALGAGNYGTSDIISVCMGTAGLCIAYSPKPIRHPKGMCQIQGHPAGGYLIEAHSSSCMSSWRWAGNVLYSGEDPSDGKDRIMTEAAARSPAGANGVFFLPWLQGAACPHYNDSARGAYIGMSLANGREDLIRATMEGICFENRMMLETLFETDIPETKALRAVGGASNSDFWNQMQADIYGMPVETVTAKESSALGAAVICAVASGMYESYKEASHHMTHLLKKYDPDPRTAEKYQRIYEIWNTCYEDLSRDAFRQIYDYQTDR